MKILLLEDDKEILRWVNDGPTRCGHVVDWLENGRNTLINATTHDYDVKVPDRMTPELDRFSVLKCSIPDDHIDPRRSAFFIARLVLEDIRKEKRDARSTA